MSPRAAKPRAADVDVLVPEPAAVVRRWPDPTPLIREYVENEFARLLATEYERQVRVLVEEGAAVPDAAAYARVGARLKEVAELRKAIEAWFDPIVAWFYRAHAMVCARRTAALAPLLAYETTAKVNRL